RVAAARAVQAERYAAVGLAGVSTNAAAPTRAIEELAAVDSSAQALVREAAERFALSARGYHRVLKLARTIADLDGSSAVRRAHLAEALAYRTGMDRSAHAAA
ncbi:MAG: ATP-binding protein, partial [Hyphomicrobiales bacterium]|nr:ATP-binding protein [Hyphomicrobiales bacterium]